MDLDLEKEKIYFNALNIVLSCNYSALRRLKSIFSSFQEVYLKFPSLPYFEKFKERYQEIDPEEEFGKLINGGVNLILFEEKTYPSLLKEISLPPFGLYIKSKLEFAELFGDSLFVSIVGTRKPTPFSKEMAKTFSSKLSRAGFKIVSGLALGIDKAAHLGALEGRGMTVAVLASGLDLIYPSQHRELASLIENSGALVSECPFNTEPKPFRFISRNRIIAGISQAVFVVEAPLKSGSLTTAHFAMKEKRKVFALPHNLSNGMGLGTNKLIQEGAKLVTSIEDILTGLGKLDFKEKEEKDFLAPEEKEVVTILKRYQIPLELERIISATNRGSNEILNILSSLELKGFVKEVGGRWQVLK